MKKKKGELNWSLILITLILSATIRDKLFLKNKLFILNFGLEKS
jgi:cytochrome c oxidase subunit IV